MWSSRGHEQGVRSVHRQRRIHESVNAVIMRDQTPSSLSDQELGLDRLPITRTPVPEKVKAWVRYGEVALRIDAELVAWTSRACAVRWKTQAGVAHRAWVWASAVEKVSPR